MYRFKKIMVALDLSNMDEKIVAYTSAMAKVIHPEKIYFINIQPNLDLDDEIKALLGDADTPVDEQCEASMKATVESAFVSNDTIDIQYEIVEGNPSEEILRWTKMKDIDLLLMGRKNESKGGITPQQVAAKVRSSVLIIPENARAFSLNHICVPTDFSASSKAALEEAMFIDQNHPAETTITCSHIYRLPLGFEKSGKTEEEFSAIMEKNATKKYNSFVEAIPYETNQVTAHFKKSIDNDVADDINNVAHAIHADLIIVGAKGRTIMSNLFLGSFTEKLIKYDSDIPLLVAKDKDNTFDFWEMVKSI